MGPAGPAGPAGPQGPQGPAGSRGSFIIGTPANGLAYDLVTTELTLALTDRTSVRALSPVFYTLLNDATSATTSNALVVRDGTGDANFGRTLTANDKTVTCMSTLNTVTTNSMTTTTQTVTRTSTLGTVSATLGSRVTILRLELPETI